MKWPTSPRAAPTAVTSSPRAQILRFALAGLLNTAFGYSAFLACLAVGLPVLPALLLSTAAGVLFNYQTARRLVFRCGVERRLPQFVALYACVTGLDWAALRLLAVLGVPAWLAQAGLVLPLAALTFAAQRCLVFRTHRDR